MTEIPKFSNFQSFYAFFVEVSADFEDWNVLRGQRENHWLSRVLFRRLLHFAKRNCLKLPPKMTKIPKFSNFQKFYAFFSRFLKDFVD